MVATYQAIRRAGVSTAAILSTEASDLRRFDCPWQVMAFLRLVPLERSTGDTRYRGGTTKTGNIRDRMAQVEVPRTYRHPAGVWSRRVMTLF